MIRRRCCKCGKFSNNRMGEYVRKDHSAGYINQEEGEPGPICTDCRELIENEEAAATAEAANQAVDNRRS